MHDLLLHLGQVLFAGGFGLWVVLRLLIAVAERHPAPPEPLTPTQRFIERDWGKHGVYNHLVPTDWNALERDLERTLRARSKHGCQEEEAL